MLVQSFGLRVSSLQALHLNPYQKWWEGLIMGLYLPIRWRFIGTPGWEQAACRAVEAGY